MATSAQPEPKVTVPLDIDELAAKVSRLVSKKDGDPSEAIALVMKENANYRDRHRDDARTIKEQSDKIKELETKAPGKDDIVLKGDEAKAYTALMALKPTVQEVTDLRTFKTNADHKAKMKEVGEAAGYNPEALAEVLMMKGMMAVMVEATVPDEKDKSKLVKKNIPHVRPITDTEGKVTPILLTEYVDKNLQLFLPALRKDAKGHQSGRSSDGRSDGHFTPLPAQSAASGSMENPGQSDVVKSVGDSMGFALPSDFTKSKKE